jgi:protease IV
MSFLKSLLATILGIFISFFLLMVLLIGIVASSSSETEPFIRDGSVLTINLSGSVGERRTEDPFLEAFDRGQAEQITMDRFRSNIKKAKSDSRIAGIRLNLRYLGGSWAHLSEIRDLLLDFKESGKFIYAYIEDLGTNEAAYFIATASDSIFAQPETYLEMDGFYIQASFFADTFEKYGLKADVVTAGTYKSAADSYINTEFSTPDREQLGEILSQFSREFVTAVSEFTGHYPEYIDEMMNAVPDVSIAGALERGLIQGLMFPSEMDNFLTEKTDSRIYREVTFARYSRVSPSKAGVIVPRRAKEIAIIYAEGPIMPDMGSDLFSASANLTYKLMKEAFDEVLENDNVAAIVVRINSPGGAVTTSEIIKNLMAEATSNKPVIASMGSVAASGGYYIAMGADTVVAEPLSITGSIGVVMAKLSYGDALEKQFGIKHDEIRTHRHADWFSPVGSLTAEQRRSLEAMADATYQSFLQLVADARGKQTSDIHTVAQGRVWTGQDAYDIGLVDVLGTLPDAVRIAAEMAGIDEYVTASYPQPKTFLETFMDTGNTQIRSGLSRILGRDYLLTQLYRDLNVLQRPQVYSLLPVEFSVN